MPEYEVKVTGGKLVRGLVVCDSCGRCDTVVTYCRAYHGTEIEERECLTCGRRIEVETKEVKRDV